MPCARAPACGAPCPTFQPQVVAAVSTRFGSNAYSSAPKAIGCCAVPDISAPSPCLSSPPQPERRCVFTSWPGGRIRAWRRIICAPCRATAASSPAAARPGRGRDRVRRQDRVPKQDRPPTTGPCSSTSAAPAATRSRPPTPTARSPRARSGRRAHRRPELQRPQGDPRRRAVRDPQRRLLRRDHAGERRGGQGRPGRGAVRGAVCGQEGAGPPAGAARPWAPSSREGLAPCST